LPRIARHPDLLVWWDPDGFVVRNLESGVTLSGEALDVEILAFFDRPREMREAESGLPRYGAPRVRGRARLLCRLGFLIPDAEARRKRSLIAAWQGNVASALHHSASRDLRFLQGQAAEGYVRERISHRRPALSKHYRGATRVPLPETPHATADLESTLEARRTVRAFRSRPVDIADFSAVVGGTFGSTGTHHGGPFGTLMTKTSPSAGSLHPIECYAIAWNVRGLMPGLYHFDVGARELRRLRRGRFGAEAVRAASGQSWVGRAAFACVMTAVFVRSLWKYEDEVTYRTLFLDAGHLAQTFCLLATSRGLGPFTTAAIQDTFIAKLLQLDGASEFPVYLCGAGVPALSAAGARPRRGLRSTNR
jgi:SagB-type dehydrogenase family enzyme